MISTYTYKKLTWVDVTSPTQEEIIRLSETYNLPALVGEEMMGDTLRSKVDVYNKLIYLVLHFPRLRLDAKNELPPEQEIDFIIGHDFIITVHYELVQPLDQFTKSFTLDSILDKSTNNDHIGFLFFYMIKEIYKHTVNELDSINTDMKRIERNIFENREKHMVQDILSVNRKLIDFKQALRFHADTLASFEKAGKPFFGPDFEYYLSAITGEYNKVQAMIDGHKEILTDLSQTNDSLLAYKTNETMRTLTIITFIISPITVISSIFMMNTSMTLIENYTEFYYVLGAMLVTSIITFIYFKSKKWL